MKRYIALGLASIILTFSVATPVQAQSVAELQAQIQALLAQLASVQSGGSATTSSVPVHVVSVYEAKGAQHSFCESDWGTVTVNVTATGPIKLVLSAYEPVIWNVTNSGGADIQKVILTGYNPQAVQGQIKDGAIEHHTYYNVSRTTSGNSSQDSFIKNTESQPGSTIYSWASQCPESKAVPVSERAYLVGSNDYAYAAQSSGSDYEKLVTKVKQWSGAAAIASVQTAYAGSSFTVGGSATQPSASIRVTAPNGGEQWEIGQLNTITWAPYGYNPDVNPAKDVIVFLERADGSTAGQIMDTGKASLHTYFNIASYDTWATPGQYRVYVANKVTGATDKSDALFTLLPRAVDIKVNGSDGPVTLTDNQPVTVTYKTIGMTSCTLNGLRKTQGGGLEAIPIGASSENGQETAYAYAPSAGVYVSIYAVCNKSDGTTRSDTVQVNISSSAASVHVETPNGGERIALGQPYEIKWKEVGVKYHSIALYRNDQWQKWLVKDELSGAENVSIGGTGSFQWIPTAAELGNVNELGTVFKIYITGQKADGTGYVDDKSDTAFSFSSNTSVPPGVWCTVDDALLGTNDSWTYFSIKKAPAGKKCTDFAQKRTCNEGVLSGNASYAYASCTDSYGTGSCILDGVEVATGKSRKFYSDSAVAYGKSCDSVSQMRSCTGSSLNGSTAYRYATCKVAAAKSCSLGGVTVAHGESRRFYLAASQIGSCTSVVRTCNNGVLSGTNYTNAKCTVRASRESMISDGASQTAAAMMALDDVLADIKSWVIVNMLSE